VNIKFDIYKYIGVSLGHRRILAQCEVKSNSNVAPHNKTLIIAADPGSDVFYLKDPDPGCTYGLLYNFM
jgi:hypothetical protein